MAAYYKVKLGKQIAQDNRTYDEDSIVSLSDKEAAYHASNIERVDYPPSSDAVAIFNFAVAEGSDFDHVIGLGTKTIKVKTFTLSNPLIIESLYPHNLVTGNRIYLYASRLS